jgi:VanZ family protein
VFCIAVLWECIEAYLETPNKTEILHVYKSREQYIYDSIADVIGAVIITVLVVFNK